MVMLWLIPCLFAFDIPLLTLPELCRLSGGSVPPALAKLPGPFGRTLVQFALCPPVKAEEVQYSQNLQNPLIKEYTLIILGILL